MSSHEQRQGPSQGQQGQTQRRYLRGLISAIVAAGLASPGYGASPGYAELSPSGPAPTKAQVSRIADLQVVDCLLPGVVRRLGQAQFLSPRRPISTTAADCRIRGGEYTDFDRADYKTALSIWMPSAESGEPEAQTNVGEIFERGLGGEPNYEAAAIWYQKAATQGNSRAQFNLGTLYEQGLGVEKDRLLALNWYRQAWGMTEDNVIFQSAADEEINQLRQQLQQEIELRDSRIKRLENDKTELDSKIKQQQASAAASTSEGEAMSREVADLQQWILSLKGENEQVQARLSKLPYLREPAKTVVSTISEAPLQADAVKADGLEFGRYYALIIGNQDYTHIAPLETPINDSNQLADLLRDKYGFTVDTLFNANNIEVMEAINNLKDKLTANDNLLIYYAGHGSRMSSGKYTNGYWLPVNAEAPPRDTFWVSNEFITRHLSRLDARRVLVIADSCYAGMLSDAPGFLMLGAQANNNPDFIKYKLPKRSRLLLSSGGDKPVIDNGAPGHSIFASLLLKTLEENNRILTSPELYATIADKVKQGAKDMGFDQQPEFKVIKGAGHEVGDFFFVPTKG